MRRSLMIALSVGVAVSAAPPAWGTATVSSTADRIPASTNGRVDAMVQIGSRIYLGGSFTSASGLARRGLVAVDASTGKVDSGWKADVAGTVLVLAASPDGTTLYVGGSFTKVDGANRLNLAAVTAAGGAVTPWNPGASNGSVQALAVNSSTVFAGGSFTAAGSTTIGRLVSLDRATGHANSGFDPHPSAGVDTLLLAGTTLYVGGKFTTIAGVSRPHLAALSASTGNATGYRPQLNCPALDLVSDASKIYVACAGGKTGGNSVVAFRTGTTGTTSPTWLRQGNGNVQSVTLLGGVIYAGGHFGTMAGATRHHGAAFDPGNGTLLGWAPVFNSALGVWVVRPAGGALWAGGDFTSVNQVSHPHVARFS